jgi:cytochrome c
MDSVKIPLAKASSVAVVAISLMLLFSSAARADDGSIEEGRRLFVSKCSLCHTWEKNVGNSTGPNLYGVTGRGQATLSGYPYSEAFLKQAGKNWDSSQLDQFLASPRKFTPGTLMIFPGLASETDRRQIILFLQSLK